MKRPSDANCAHTPRRRIVVAVLILTAALMCVAAASALVRHNRVSRANERAVALGLAPTRASVSLRDRCVARAIDEYDASTDPGKAGIPPRAFRFVIPKACALGIRRGLVRDSGSFSGNAWPLFNEAGNRYGKARIQMMIFTELAVVPYRLKRTAAAVTRFDRCLAMGFSAYDATPAEVKQASPPRATFFRIVRRACTIGIRRGLIPESGAPSRSTTAALLRQAELPAG
jgi:hypothetical protein